MCILEIFYISYKDSGNIEGRNLFITFTPIDFSNKMKDKKKKQTKQIIDEWKEYKTRWQFVLLQKSKNNSSGERSKDNWVHSFKSYKK